MVASLNLALMQCPSFSLTGFPQMKGSVCVCVEVGLTTMELNTGVPGFDIQYTCIQSHLLLVSFVGPSLCRLFFGRTMFQSILFFVC